MLKEHAHVHWLVMRPRDEGGEGEGGGERGVEFVLQHDFSRSTRTDHLLCGVQMRQTSEWDERGCPIFHATSEELERVRLVANEAAMEAARLEAERDKQRVAADLERRKRMASSLHGSVANGRLRSESHKRVRVGK